MNTASMIARPQAVVMLVRTVDDKLEGDPALPSPAAQRQELVARLDEIAAAADLYL